MCRLVDSLDTTTPGGQSEARASDQQDGDIPPPSEYASHLEQSAAFAETLVSTGIGLQVL